MESEIRNSFVGKSLIYTCNGKRARKKKLPVVGCQLSVKKIASFDIPFLYLRFQISNFEFVTTGF